MTRIDRKLTIGGDASMQATASQFITDLFEEEKRMMQEKGIQATHADLAILFTDDLNEINYSYQKKLMQKEIKKNKGFAGTHTWSDTKLSFRYNGRVDLSKRWPEEMRNYELDKKALAKMREQEKIEEEKREK